MKITDWSKSLTCFLFCICCTLVMIAVATAAPIIVDHRHTDITAIPEDAIVDAKNSLHIAYGHTSHGSQLTTGMDGLVAFANGGGLGLSLPVNIFAFNHGGSGGALDLHDYAMGGDVGYWPDWYDNTVEYLDNPENAGVNVIIWSWCGQVGDKYVDGLLESEYLTPMSQLEQAYPDVTFVYMTGHVNFWEDAKIKAANQVIRDYVSANNKVLYDFADIEHYDPDGTYYEFVHDNCNYYSSVGGVLLGNWATEWQDSHVEGVDWYECGAAHSKPLNANRKAYAAWHLWAVLGGWSPGGAAIGVTIDESGGATSVVEGGSGDVYTVRLDSRPTSPVDITIQPSTQLNVGNGEGSAATLTFTSNNWSAPQTVNVAASNDSLKECNHAATISHRASSADARYNNIEIDSVRARIRDDDRANCTVVGILPVLLEQSP